MESGCLNPEFVSVGNLLSPNYFCIFLKTTFSITLDKLDKSDTGLSLDTK